jgi:hypothetical protein
MQVPGTQKTMYSLYFEHKITGKSLQDLGCSEIVLTKLHFFELHSSKTVTQICALSEGWLSEYETYELKKINKLSRTCLKTFGKGKCNTHISDFTIFHYPCLYHISTFKKRGQPAPLFWLVGWTLARFSSEEIVQNGGSKVVLGKVKKIIALLKKREITMQDVKDLGIELSNTELREINCLRSTFHLKFSVQPVKALANTEKEEVKVV